MSHNLLSLDKWISSISNARFYEDFLGKLAMRLMLYHRHGHHLIRTTYFYPGLYLSSCTVEVHFMQSWYIYMYITIICQYTVFAPLQLWFRFISSTLVEVSSQRVKVLYFIYMLSNNLPFFCFVFSEREKKIVEASSSDEDTM